VKNTVRLQFVFKEYLTQLIDEYVHEFRPTLLRGRKDDYLFPGLREGAKQKVSFSVEISRYIEKATGLTTAAVKLPGFPYLASALLGQADPRIADEHYKRTTSLNAASIYGNLVQDYLN
jgi:hypothetical protein